MSQTNEARCTKGQSISNPGAFARHADACDTCERDSPKSQDGNAIRETDIESQEIAHATANMREADFNATLELHDFKPKDGDTLRTATAKALVDAKGGGKSLYSEVFGQCKADDCDYGCNGFEADYCARSDHVPSGETDETDETDETETSNDSPEGARETDRATYVKELIDVGVSPVKAEEAATARFD